MTQSTVFEAESNQGRGAEAPNGLGVNSTVPCSPEPAGGSAPLSGRQTDTGPTRGFRVPQTCLSTCWRCALEGVPRLRASVSSPVKWDGNPSIAVCLKDFMGQCRGSMTSVPVVLPVPQVRARAACSAPCPPAPSSAAGSSGT